jgi:GMP synthase (glutamine-hydrolysing)
MKKVLVLQHVPYEILGTLDPLLRGAGYRIRYVNFGRAPDVEPNVDKYQGVIILGGPMNVDMTDQYPHLDTEVRLIRRAAELGIPILGICLGAQLIAKALGAQVYKNPVKEIGWYNIELTDQGKDDPVLRHFEDSRLIFEWHGDTFDLPEGAVHLAKGSTCPHQAFRVGENIYGFQFHLEVDGALVERWLNTPVYRAEIESTNGLICPHQVRAETAKNIDQLMALSQKVFGEFLNIMGHAKRFMRLNSK